MGIESLIYRKGIRIAQADAIESTERGHGHVDLGRQRRRATVVSREDLASEKVCKRQSFHVCMWILEGHQSSFSLARRISMHAAAAKLTREREGSWVEDADGPQSGNGGRDGLGRKRRAFRGGVLGSGNMVMVTIGFSHEGKATCCVETTSICTPVWLGFCCVISGCSSRHRAYPWGR